MLVGKELIPYTASPLSINSEKSAPFIFYNSFVTLNFLSPAIKFFHIPLANFLMYLLEVLSGAMPFRFFYFSQLYLAFFVIQGNVAQNYSTSSIPSAYNMQIRRSLVLSYAYGAYFSNTRISRLSYFDITPLLQIQSSAQQNQFNLLFFAQPIISPALLKCHQIFLNFQLFYVYSQEESPINFELIQFECSPNFISEIRQFFFYNHIQSCNDNQNIYLFFVTLLPILFILQIFYIKLAQVMPWESIGKQSVYRLKIQNRVQLLLGFMFSNYVYFAQLFETDAYFYFSFYTRILDFQFDWLQMKMGCKERAVSKLIIYTYEGNMHIVLSIEQYPTQEYYIFAIREITEFFFVEVSFFANVDNIFGVGSLLKCIYTVVYKSSNKSLAIISIFSKVG